MLKAAQDTNRDFSYKPRRQTNVQFRSELRSSKSKFSQFRNLRKLRVRLPFVAALAAAGFMLLLAYYLINTSDYFNVKVVNWRGDLTYLAQVRSDTESRVLNKSLIKLDVKEIEDRISANTYIREVVVEKTFPDTINIFVAVTEPGFYIVTPERIVLYSKDSQVLSSEDLEGVALNSEERVIMTEENAVKTHSLYKLWALRNWQNFVEQFSQENAVEYGYTVSDFRIALQDISESGLDGTINSRSSENRDSRISENRDSDQEEVRSGDQAETLILNDFANFLEAKFFELNASSLTSEFKIIQTEIAQRLRNIWENISYNDLVRNVPVIFSFVPHEQIQSQVNNQSLAQIDTFSAFDAKYFNELSQAAINRSQGLGLVPKSYTLVSNHVVLIELEPTFSSQSDSIAQTGSLNQTDPTGEADLTSPANEQDQTALTQVQVQVQETAVKLPGLVSNIGPPQKYFLFSYRKDIAEQGRQLEILLLDLAAKNRDFRKIDVSGAKIILSQ